MFNPASFTTRDTSYDLQLGAGDAEYHEWCNQLFPVAKKFKAVPGTSNLLYLVVGESHVMTLLKDSDTLQLHECSFTEFKEAIKTRTLHECPAFEVVDINDDSLTDSVMQYLRDEKII